MNRPFVSPLSGYSVLVGMFLTNILGNGLFVRCGLMSCSDIVGYGLATIRVLFSEYAYAVPKNKNRHFGASTLLGDVP